MSTQTPHIGLDQIRKGLSLSDLGVIISLVISALTGAFTFGVMWGQVSENTKFRIESQERQTLMREDIASIRTSVEYLVDRDKNHRDGDHNK